MLAAGLATSAVSGIGIAAARRQSMLLLNVHLLSQGSLLAAQVFAVVTFVVQVQESKPQPQLASIADTARPSVLLASEDALSDASATPHATVAALHASTILSSMPAPVTIHKMVGIAGLVLQVLTLSVGCLLQSAYSQAEEAAEDEAEEAGGEGWGPSSRQPLLSGGPPPPPPTRGRRQQREATVQPGAGATDEESGEQWRQRMQAQYGLDAGLLAQDMRGGGGSTAPQLTPAPAAAQRRRRRTVPEEAEEGDEGGSRCSLM